MHNLTVLDTGEDRESWLKARTGLITATQAAAIVGSHPYAKMIDVWNEHTDPDYDRESDRNPWLKERAELGVNREAEIIAWLSEEPKAGGSGAPFTPSSALVTRPELVGIGHASTPDAYKVVRGKGLILAEVKTTSQDWETKGIPQHIIDQVLWQMYTTGAVTVWIGWERYAWSGRGASRTAELISTGFRAIRMDEAYQRRLDFILAEVAKFQQMMLDEIAPESDVDLAEEPPAPDFDSTPEELEAWAQEVAERAEARALLIEQGELEREIATAVARIDKVKDRLKIIVKGYHGRRVHLTDQRGVVELVRFNKATVNQSQIDPDVLRSATTWGETERVVIRTFPAPAADETPAEPAQ